MWERERDKTIWKQRMQKFKMKREVHGRIGPMHQQSIKPLLNLKKMGQQFAATFISNVYMNIHYE